MIKLSKRKKEILGLILILFSILTTVSLIGYDETENPRSLIDQHIKTPLGIWGVHLAYAHFYVLGYVSIIFPFIYFIIGYCLFTDKSFKKYTKIISYILIIGLYISLLMGYIYEISDSQLIASLLMGKVGHSLHIYLIYLLGSWGTLMFLIVSFNLEVMN